MSVLYLGTYKDCLEKQNKLEEELESSAYEKEDSSISRKPKRKRKQLKVGIVQVVTEVCMFSNYHSWNYCR